MQPMILISYYIGEGLKNNVYRTADIKRSCKQHRRVAAMEDKTIIDLYFERKEDALKATDQKYSAYLKTVIGGILNRREDIEECLNDTYMAVWDRIPPEKPVSFRAFVAKIARYTALNKYDYISAKKRNAEFDVILSELEECLSAGNTVEKELEAGQLREALNNFLYGLEKEKRLVFLRRYWFGDSIETIANNFGLSESKVKSMLFRLRGQLKEHLKKEGIEI